MPRRRSNSLTGSLSLKRLCGRAGLIVAISLGGTLTGCSGDDPEGPQATEESPPEERTPETQNPEAPPLGAPRPKIRPGDVNEEE